MTEQRQDPLLTSEQEARRLLVAVQIPNEGPLIKEHAEAVVSAVHGHMIKFGLTQKDVAKACKGIAGGTLSQILKFTYHAQTLDDHLRTLNHWIEQDARRRAGSQGRRAITNTAVVRWIQSAADTCRQNNTMAVVMGPAGIGKTVTAREIAKTLVGCVYVSINQYNATQQTLLTELCDKLNVGKRRRRKDLVGVNRFQRIKMALEESNRLLILDDADKLRESALELIREIHDATGVPILMIGVIDLWERILRMTDEDHGQLKSRIGVRFNLRNINRNPKSGTRRPIFRIEEIRQMCSPAKVKLTGRAADYLLKVGNKDGEGAIRRCLQLVAMAARVARKNKDLAPDAAVAITERDLHHVAVRCDMTGYDDVLIDECVSEFGVGMARSA